MISVAWDKDWISSLVIIVFDSLVTFDDDPSIHKKKERKCSTYLSFFFVLPSLNDIWPWGFVSSNSCTIFCKSNEEEFGDK